jgi:L-alanine-DL-glutamate epimerase-like enolase superfamily enzyme
MKVTGFETRVVRLPREEGPLGTAPGAAAAHFVTLKVRADDGIEGIAFSGYVNGVMVPALKAALDALAEQAVGADPMMTEAVNARLMALAGGAPAGLHTRAVSAIDVALWDIKGKALGQPVYRLLGGYRDRVPVYASGYLWRPYSLQMLAETGPRLVEQGFRAMKFRMGAEDRPSKEIARMRVLREAVGDDIDLMVDINQGWSVDQAITIGRELAPYHLYWLEDPVHHQDYAGLARIADALDTPIASGEYHYGVMPFQHMIERHSIDIVMVDLLRAGGLTGFMKAAHMAEAFNLPVVSHLATEVLVHAIAAAPNGLTVEHMPWSFPMFKEVPKVEDGMLVVPQSPGLGLEFDEAALDRFAQ